MTLACKAGALCARVLCAANIAALALLILSIDGDAFNFGLFLTLGIIFAAGAVFNGLVSKCARIFLSL